MLKQEPSLESLHRSYRSTFYVWFNFKQEPSCDRFTGAIARLSLFCQSIEDPCSVTAICNFLFLQYYLTFIQDWAFMAHHGNWASVANSLLPLNSRRVSFIVWCHCHDRCIPHQNSQSCFNSSVWLMSSRQDDMSPSREPFGKELILQLTLNLHFYS